MNDQLSLDTYAAERAKQAAIAQVEAAAPHDWKLDALDAVRQAARELPEFIADAVWARMPAGAYSAEPRAMGAIMVAAQKQGWIEPTDRWQLSASPRNHRRPQRVWRSIICHEVV